MISAIGKRAPGCASRRRRRRREGLSLLELILVLALLVVLVGAAAPMLGRSTRARIVENELRQIESLLERARAEAIARAVPVRVWLDVAARRAGWETRPGFGSDAASPAPLRLRDDLQWSVTDPPETARDGAVTLVVFEPDGAPMNDRAATVAVATAFGEEELWLRLADDAWGFETGTNGAP
jgi:Tfp pilus assembly protein FimT